MAKKSILDQHLDIVGVLPDREVAERLGMCAENVRLYRKRRNISAQWRGEGGTVPRTVAPKKTGPTGKSRRKSKLDPFVGIIGQVPDQEVADRAAVSLSNVRQFRYRHGISLQTKVPKKVVPETKATPHDLRHESRPKAPTNGVSKRAFTLTTSDNQEYTVAAPDISLAVKHAQWKLPSATFIKVTDIGAAL